MLLKLRFARVAKPSFFSLPLERLPDYAKMLYVILLLLPLIINVVSEEVAIEVVFYKPLAYPPSLLHLFRWNTVILQPFQSYTHSEHSMANRSPEARETLCFHGFPTEVKLGLVSRLINSFPFTPIFGFVAKRSAIVLFLTVHLIQKHGFPLKRLDPKDHGT